MYTEKQLQEAIQTTVLTSTVTQESFAAGAVLINDWSIFDKQIALSPYLIIGNCPDPTIDYRNDEQVWRIPLVLAAAFQKTYADTENKLRDHRQELITLFRTDPYQQLGLSTADEGLEIQEFTPKTDFLPWFDPTLDEEDLKEATPLHLFQELALTVRNY